MDKFVIIDGNSLINRAFYALPPLANNQGVYSNAVFGFCNMLVKVITEIKPKYICVAFDYGKKTFRNELFADYKGTRKGTPEELKSQFPLLKEVLQSMNISMIEQSGIEADDIIGTLTKRFDSVQNIVITGDKDCLQLVNNNTTVMLTKKGISETLDYTPDFLMEDFGLQPCQIVELKALMGDSSDNIPGVPGVGEKTAKDLLSKYTTIDGVYQNLDELKGKLLERLQDNKELAYLSKVLATIKCDCEFDAVLDTFDYDFPFGAKAFELFNHYQFKSLIKRKEIFAEGNVVEANKDLGECKVVVLKTMQEVDDMICAIKKSKQLYLHTENCFSIYVDGVEYNAVLNPNLIEVSVEVSKIVLAIKDVFENAEIKKYVFDAKSTMHMLDKYNIGISNIVFDVLVARYLINNNNKNKITYSDMLYENGLTDNYFAFNLSYLCNSYMQEMEKYNLVGLFNSIELPLTSVLFEMEKAGFAVDKNALVRLDEKYTAELQSLTNEIHALAGVEFNINSPKQLAEVLFETLNLPLDNNKKRSTGIEVLTKLIGRHPIIDSIVRYRKISKLHSTYVKAFISLMNEKTGKINTIFNQTTTSTGRLSSSEPNLQNVPVRTEEGKVMREVFVPSNQEGFIVAADYSQIELRLLADFSGDSTLINAFNGGKDIHAITAMEVFNVAECDVTEQMRRDAKAINFGIIYGISDFGLSQNINSTPKLAKLYMDQYFDKYPSVKQYMNDNVDFCKVNGYVKTYFNRIRFIPEVNNSNFALRNFGERAAMNMPLQGSASDIIKLAMINVNMALKLNNLKSKLILQIHDELIIDCEPDELDMVQAVLIDCMENVVQLQVPLSVNVSVGKNWCEAK